MREGRRDQLHGTREQDKKTYQITWHGIQSGDINIGGSVDLDDRTDELEVPWGASKSRLHYRNCVLVLKNEGRVRSTSQIPEIAAETHIPETDQQVLLSRASQSPAALPIGLDQEP